MRRMVQDVNFDESVEEITQHTVPFQRLRQDKTQSLRKNEDVALYCGDYRLNMPSNCPRLNISWQ